LAAKRATKFYLVREVISLFLQMGCELREAEATIHEDGDSFNFRYLIDPETKAFVPVVYLDDSELFPKVRLSFGNAVWGLIFRRATESDLSRSRGIAGCRPISLPPARSAAAR
jgi:hypothetical protein